MKNNNWFRVFARNCAPLQFSIQWHYKKLGLELEGITWQQTGTYQIRYGTTLGYMFFNNNYPTKSNYPQKIRKINPKVDSYYNEAVEIIDRDLQLNPSNKREDLLDITHRLGYHLNLMVMGYELADMTRKQMENVFDSKILDELEEFLSHPFKPSFISLEHEALTKANQDFKKNPKSLSASAKKLTKKFGYAHNEYLGRVWNKKDYENEIKSMKDIHNKKSVDLEKYNFNEYQKWLISIYKKCVYVFDEGKTAIIRAAYCMRETFKNLGLAENEIFKYTYEEFIIFIKKGIKVDKKTLSSRGKYHMTSLLDGKLEETYDKNKIDKVMKNINLSEFDDLEDTLEIKGNIANKGKVTGKVRIVFSYKDSEKIKEGDILVASMTTPELLSGMRKAAAFVTDEGGITCHAAIISREMNKPCVIGTKVATRVLKDGDKVLVDANKGIVKKIK